METHIPEIPDISDPETIRDILHEQLKKESVKWLGQLSTIEHYQEGQERCNDLLERLYRLDHPETA